MANLLHDEATRDAIYEQYTLHPTYVSYGELQQGIMPTNDRDCADHYIIIMINKNGSKNTFDEGSAIGKLLEQLDMNITSSSILIDPYLRYIADISTPKSESHKALEKNYQNAIQNTQSTKENRAFAHSATIEPNEVFFPALNIAGVTVPVNAPTIRQFDEILTYQDNNPGEKKLLVKKIGELASYSGDTYEAQLNGRTAQEAPLPTRTDPPKELQQYVPAELMKAAKIRMENRMQQNPALTDAIVNFFNRVADITNKMETGGVKKGEPRAIVCLPRKACEQIDSARQLQKATSPAVTPPARPPLDSHKSKGKSKKTHTVTFKEHPERSGTFYCNYANEKQMELDKKKLEEEGYSIKQSILKTKGGQSTLFLKATDMHQATTNKNGSKQIQTTFSV